MKDETEHTCQFCYYEYFDSRAYPCSMCVCGEERKDMFKPKIAEQTEPQKLECRNKEHYSSCEYVNECDPIVCFKALDAFAELLNAEPQTERIKTLDYCDICNHKGCDNCIANNLDDYCVPSGYEPITQTETQNSNLSFEKDECAKEYDELGLKELKELINAYRKTENSSEKPNNCDTCKWGEWYRKGYDITMMSDECGGCCSWNNKWTPKDEPQPDCAWK